MANLKYYGLPQDDVLSHLYEIEQPLRQSDDLFARRVGEFLYFQRDILRDPNRAMRLRDYLEFVGTAVYEPEYLAEQQEFMERSLDKRVLHSVGSHHKGLAWGKAFIKRYLREIRNAICRDGKEYSDIQTQGKNYTEAASASIAAIIVKAIGLAEPLALGLGTLIFFTIMRTTKNTFCRMTDTEVLDAINEDLSKPLKPARRADSSHYHLTKKKSKWRLEKAGSDRAVVQEPTKQSALKRSREYVKRKSGVLYVHRENGSVQDVFNYSK